ncbi:hypothetical protein H6P81_013762 [Aristolochia fimbriata]|uniref:Uncharacterized protein n=1 Tax=Aristolochia fimbriata TaxID=158543 RepID=A0AAV7EG11_ARIFI|nr:hypothetical protein H6P81_013762 [Aristolochia fimbriata]
MKQRSERSMYSRDVYNSANLGFTPFTTPRSTAKQSLSSSPPALSSRSTTTDSHRGSRKHKLQVRLPDGYEGNRKGKKLAEGGGAAEEEEREGNSKQAISLFLPHEDKIPVI